MQFVLKHQVYAFSIYSRSIVDCSIDKMKQLKNIFEMYFDSKAGETFLILSDDYLKQVKR